MERLHCSKAKVYDLVKRGRLEKVLLDGRMSRITERSIRKLEQEAIKAHGRQA